MEHPETLAQGSLASEPAKALILEEDTVKVGSRVSNETLIGSQLPLDVPLDRIEGNGIRVFVNNGEGASSKLQENGKEFGEAGSAAKENKDSGGAQALLETVLEEGSSRLNRCDSSTKIKVSGDDLPLLVDIHGSYEEASEKSYGDKNPVFKQEVGLLSDNERNPGADGVSIMPVPMVETKKNNNVEGKEEKEEVDEEEEEEEQVANDQEHEFSIGDFVWAKIKSHPWWPGQIFDPSDASKSAAKYHRRDRHLVAYFGDGTFAWCYPSQLKPFQENFELMSKQSSSKNFLNAIEEALNEISRRIELEMTCTCVPEEFRNRLAKPLAVNNGIREGVTVPDGGIHELTITLYEPAEFLAHLKDVAVVVSVNNIVELTVLCSHLSAFYRAKGYWRLPLYNEADGITSPEDCAANEEMHKIIVDGQAGELNLHPVEVDCVSSPVTHGVSDNKLYQRKKQKSMTELLAGDVDVECWNNSNVSDVAGEVVSGKLVSTSKKKRKDSEDDINIAVEDSGGDHMGLQSKKLYKSKRSVSPPTADKRSSSINNDDGGAKAAALSSTSPRVRKKSKYLSPPYTDLSHGSKSLNSSKDSETESGKAKKVSSMGECIHDDADQLTGTTPTQRCSGLTFQKKPSKEMGVRRKTSGNFSPRTPNGGNYKNIFMEGNAFTDEMFSDFLTIALDPFYLNGSRRFDTFKGFFSRFRSSMYHSEPNSMMDNEQLVVQDGTKRKSLESNPGSSDRAIQATDHPSSEPKSKGKRGDNEKQVVQVGRKRKSLVSNPGSSKRASQATDHPSSELESKSKRGDNEQLVVQDGTNRKSLESNPGSSERAIQPTDHPSSEAKSKGKRGDNEQIVVQGGRKRKSLESNPGSSERASKATDHPSSQPKSEGKRGDNEQLVVQDGTKWKSLESNPGSSERAIQTTDHPFSEPKSKGKRGDNEQLVVQGGRKRKSLESNPASSKLAIQTTDHPSSEPKSKRKRGDNEQLNVQGVRKRKSLVSNPASSKRASHATDHPSSEPKSKRKKKETEEAFLRNAKSELQQVAITSDLMMDLNKEETKDGSSAAALLLTFAPGFSLPSKDDLITIFGRFGSLNEKEMEVLGDSNCARVAFMRISDAEEAFNSSQKVSPFGHAVVNYRLHYSSAISGASELDGSSLLQPTPLAMVGNECSASPSASRPMAGEAPPLVFIKQNLEMMTSMLEKSGDKLSPKVKANLEVEIKGLLNKLSTVDDSSSS